MLILGIDPGARNYGLAVIDEKGTLQWGPLSGRTKSGDWRESYHDIVRAVSDLEYERVVIESVGWYGSRKGMYALNRLVGALWARFLDLPAQPLLVMPTEKVRLTKAQRGWADNEHEADAIALALRGIKEWCESKKSEETPKKRARTSSRKKS
jgi:Holliday junction resolvasome RuvABC endonuclease subunit